MKSIIIIIFGAAAIHFSVCAQQVQPASTNTLKVSDTKASHLVCPDKVSYVQAGDYSLIQAEIVPELSNMVRIKAVQPFEKQTSLTVVCANRIYSFELQYGNDAPITYPIETFQSESGHDLFRKIDARLRSERALRSGAKQTQTSVSQTQSRKRRDYHSLKLHIPEKRCPVF